jgi:hypothetical protein
VCQSPQFLTHIQHGVDRDTYRGCSKSFTKTTQPPSWAECNDSQKRLVLYRLAWKSVGRDGGGREVLPACMTLAIRTAYP